MTQETMRLERDTMGELPVPASSYYGASTERARRNFPISSLRLPRHFIRALGLVKGHAALVNADLGLLDRALADAIFTAATEVADGRLDGEFVIDVFQTGSGTSTNMNANEVIANRAIELLGGERGSKKPVHPNDHINICQSSNDVIPTAIQLAALAGIQVDLLPALQHLEAALRRKSDEFWGVIKTGRTHIQDATPIRLGQEFLGFAGQVERGRRRLEEAARELAEVPLGGTAVGTGVNCHPEFPQRVCEQLSRTLGTTVSETSNHFQAQSTIDTLVQASAATRTVGVSLWEIGNNIRLLGCGPRAGIAEIALPEVQPGSSIMPGKVNPVIVESLTMVCAQVIGNDTTVMLSGQGGSFFELNVMMPVAAYNLLQSIELLAAGARNFADQCVSGITATDRGPALIEQGLMLATALAPEVGYDSAAAIAKEAFRSGRTVREVARDKTNLTEDDLTRILVAEKMTEPGLGGGPAGG
ncbi:MAG: class II fumarate hydratase [Candidatus Dormibacteria bacterium]